MGKENVNWEIVKRHSDSHGVYIIDWVSDQMSECSSIENTVKVRHTRVIAEKNRADKYRVTTPAISYIVAICKQQKLLNFLLTRTVLLSYLDPDSRHYQKWAITPSEIKY